jgi:hypothetical protein
MAEFRNQSTLKFAACKPIHTQFVIGAQTFMPTLFIDFTANTIIILTPSIIDGLFFVGEDVCTIHSFEMCIM